MKELLPPHPSTFRIPLILVLILILGFHAAISNAAWEAQIDRPGSDYKSYWISGDTEWFVAVRQCEQSCKDDAICKAYTWVKPGVQGTNARCYLKNEVPQRRENDCCYSGIVRADTKADYCDVYTREAQQAYTTYRHESCGVGGNMWDGDYRYHYDWCMRVPEETSRHGAKAREAMLEKCMAPSTSGDLAVIDWCYWRGDRKIHFYPIVMNKGETTWKSSKKGNVLLGCAVHNSPNYLIQNNDIDLSEWPRMAPIEAGGITVLSGKCSWDFPVWNVNDEYQIQGWQLSHAEDMSVDNNSSEKVYKAIARDIDAGKFGHKECMWSDAYRPTSIDIRAQGIEITQAIQEWIFSTDQSADSESIPTADYPDPAKSYEAAIMVKGRSTVVRVYGAVESSLTDAPILDVDATLRCYTDNTYTQTCPGPRQLNPHATVNLDPGSTIDDQRKNPLLSWNFRLPETWSNQERIWLEASVNESARRGRVFQECIDCFDASNRIRLGNVIFYDSPDFGSDIVQIVRINNTFNKTTSQPTDNALQGYLDFVRKTYPVREGSVQSTYDSDLAYTQTSSDHAVECSKLHPYLAKNADLNGKLAVHAFIAPPYPCGGVGGGKYAFTQTGGTNETLAHELGHAIGILHAGPLPGHGSRCAENISKGVPCAECQNNSCDTDWPWPHGTIGGYGFDVLDPALQTVYLPETGAANEMNTHDFMSYGGPTQWVSQRTWARLYNAMMGEDFPYKKN